MVVSLSCRSLRVLAGSGTHESKGYDDRSVLARSKSVGVVGSWRELFVAGSFAKGDAVVVATVHRSCCRRCDRIPPRFIGVGGRKE